MICVTRRPVAAAQNIMRNDLEQDLRLSSGKLLYHHQLLRISDTCWFWNNVFTI